MTSRIRRLLTRLRDMRFAIAQIGHRRALRIVLAFLRGSGYARRARLARFRVARGLTLQRAVDVTDLWNRCHRHLSPMEQKPGIIDGELLRCPSCGDERAVRLLAHVRLGSRGWAPLRCILSCFSCHRYNLPVHQLLVPRLKQLLRLQSMQLTRIDARLWTPSTANLNLEPTTFCNFDCWYCVGRHMKQEHLDYEDFVRIIDGAPSLKRLFLTGQGEPMMNKRFFDMVKYAKKRGLRVGIISNGSMFTESMVEKICDSRLDYIEISIDAADPERFRESRVGGDLEKIWEGIERLTTHRNRRGLTRPILAVRGTLFSYSQNDIPEIVREAKKRGVDAVGPFQPLNRKESYIEIYPEDKKRHLEDTGQVVQSIRRGVVRSELPFLMEFRFQDADGEEALESWPNLLRQSCDIGSMYSLLSGDVTPCCDIMTPTTPAWNLAKHGMEAVVRDELYENMRFNLWNGFYLDRCQSCRGYTVGLMAGKRPSLPQA